VLHRLQPGWHVGSQSFGKQTFHLTFVDLLLTTHNVTDLFAVGCGPRKSMSLDIVDVQADRDGKGRGRPVGSAVEPRHSALTELLAIAGLL
jgi:hypothetical protein